MATCLPKAANRDTWDWREVRAICLRVALRYTRNRSDAEDVAQEAAIRAWRRRGTLRHGQRRDDWLRMIARNEAHRLRERRSWEQVSEEPLRGGEEDISLQQLVEGANIQIAISQLAGSDRELLGLRYEDDLTQRAIANRLGVPEGTIKVRLHRVRAKLRMALTDQ